MNEVPTCKRCYESGHYALDCTNPAKYKTKPVHLKAEPFTKQRAADYDFRKQWIARNPGPWICYLQIHPMCPYRLESPEAMTLEHVIPKGKGRRYRYDDKNILPACAACNSHKGSQSLARIIQNYPHVQTTLDFLGYSMLQ